MASDTRWPPHRDQRCGGRPPNRTVTTRSLHHDTELALARALRGDGPPGMDAADMRRYLEYVTDAR